MTGSRVALDTNQAIAVLNHLGDSGQWVQTYADVCLPVPVIGELRLGALNSKRAMENLEKVERFSARCTVLDATSKTAAQYATLRLDLKRKGTPIPENDIGIAALCIEHDVPLATSDGHFAFIMTLSLINR